MIPYAKIPYAKKENPRAWELLFNNLDSTQQRDILEKGYFIVYGKRRWFIFPRRKYVIDAATGRVWGYCVATTYTQYFTGFYPVADKALAMKFWIEGSERIFRKVANDDYRFSDHYGQRKIKVITNANDK